MTITTLAAWMDPHKISFDILHDRYGGLLNLIEQLLGVVPNCDQYLEIWPTGFRTYNLMVPNFINLPNLLLGLAAPKDLIGLGLYAASRASGCAYCSAHCCSFARRRGASADAMAGNATATEQAVIDISAALGKMPDTLTLNHVRRLHATLSPSDAEWVVMGAAMTGFLNKFMDTVGVPLEPESIADSHAVMTPTGWSAKHHYDCSAPLPTPVEPPTDGWRVYAELFRLAPQAKRADQRWQRGVPANYPAVEDYLFERIGVEEPVLPKMMHERPRRALATMLRDNLDPKTSLLGLWLKGCAAMVFAAMSNNSERRRLAETLIMRNGIALSDVRRNALIQLGQEPVPQTIDGIRLCLDRLTSADFSSLDAAALLLARASAPSPAEISDDLIAICTADLMPAEVVELITWLSLQQLLHRLDTYYSIAASATLDMSA